MTLRREFSLLLTTSLLGCGTILDGGGTSRMQLTLSATSVREGSQLPITVTLTNVSDRAVTYEDNTCPYGVYEVTDANGQRVDPRIELILCAAFSRILSLEPGQSRTWNVTWNAARYAPSTMNPNPSAAATVRLRARYWVNDQAAVTSDWMDVQVLPPS